MKRKHTGLHLAAALALAFGAAGITGCTTTGPSAKADHAVANDQVEANVDATLSRLYAAAPESRQLVERAAGVLVFPSILNAGLVVGGEHGNGVLRVGRMTVERYSRTGGSIGLQAGAQTREQGLDGRRGCDGRRRPYRRERHDRHRDGEAADRGIRAQQHRPHGGRVDRRLEVLEVVTRAAASGRDRGPRAARRERARIRTRELLHVERLPARWR